MVPTWNYATVHAHGRAQWLDEVGTIASIDRLTSQFERGQSQPWTRGLEGEALKAKLKGIVAFRLPITRLDAKFKMSQNRDADDRAGLLRGLREQGGYDEARVADWMQAHEPD
jgi:transcriptional regulator